MRVSTVEKRQSSNESEYGSSRPIMEVVERKQSDDVSLLRARHGGRMESEARCSVAVVDHGQHSRVLVTQKSGH